MESFGRHLLSNSKMDLVDMLLILSPIYEIHFDKIGAHRDMKKNATFLCAASTDAICNWLDMCSVSESDVCHA